MYGLRGENGSDVEVIIVIRKKRSNKANIAETEQNGCIFVCLLNQNPHEIFPVCFSF